jgi:hypothetical protein
VNRGIFRGIVLVILLAHPVIGLLRIDAKRWSKESDGPMGVIGDAIQMSLG